MASPVRRTNSLIFFRSALSRTSCITAICRKLLCRSPADCISRGCLPQQKAVCDRSHRGIAWKPFSCVCESRSGRSQRRARIHCRQCVLSRRKSFQIAWPIFSATSFQSSPLAQVGVSFLSECHAPAYFFQIAFPRIPAAPHVNQKLVIRHFALLTANRLRIRRSFSKRAEKADRRCRHFCCRSVNR